MTQLAEGNKETGRYKVFLNKTDKHVVILQFPHLERGRPFSDAGGSKPLQVRIKPKNALIELDVPLPDVYHVDQQLAVEYGIAMNKHKALTNGAPVGIAGGFGSSNMLRGKRERVETERVEPLVADFEHSLRTGKALNFLTLTGKIKPFDTADGSRYLGNFQGEELHLTKVSAFCTLAVGLHHLDADDLNEKTARRALQDEDAAPEKSAVVGMQVRSSTEVKTEESEWKRVLRELQEEPWQKLEWIDEAEDRSFEVFHDQLFLRDREKSNQILAVLSQQQFTDALTALHIGSSGDAAIDRLSEVTTKLDAQSDTSDED